MSSVDSSNEMRGQVEEEIKSRPPLELKNKSMSMNILLTYDTSSSNTYPGTYIHTPQHEEVCAKYYYAILQNLTTVLRLTNASKGSKQETGISYTHTYLPGSSIS